MQSLFLLYGFKPKRSGLDCKQSKEVVQRAFTAAELAYWNEYGITLDILKRFKVFSLLKFSSENSGNSREDLIKLFLNYMESIYSETMSALKSCEVDFDNPPPIAQMIVSVNDVPLGTQGNLLCVTRAPKDS